jgi:hypothetical protein
MSRELKTQVGNMDIAGLCNRVTKYAEEIIGSATAKIGGVVHEADALRWATWLDRLESYIEYHSGAEMDLPKTFDFGFSLLQSFPGDSEIETTENHIARDILRYFKSLWIEASESQSADWAASIRSGDSARFLAIVDRCRGVMSLAEPEVDLPLNKHNVPTPSSPQSGTAAARARR